VRRGNDEAPGRIDWTPLHVLQTRDIVFPTRLIGLNRDGDGEPPENLPRVFVESQSVNHDPLLGIIDLRIIVSHGTSLAQVQLRWLGLTGLRYDQHTSVPFG